jgi:hypothetical protein
MQGVANIVCGFFGAMGGCAMTGMSWEFGVGSLGFGVWSWEFGVGSLEKEGGRVRWIPSCDGDRILTIFFLDVIVSFCELIWSCVLDCRLFDLVFSSSISFFFLFFF